MDFKTPNRKASDNDYLQYDKSENKSNYSSIASSPLLRSYKTSIDYVKQVMQIYSVLKSVFDKHKYTNQLDFFIQLREQKNNRDIHKVASQKLVNVFKCVIRRKQLQTFQDIKEHSQVKQKYNIKNQLFNASIAKKKPQPVKKSPFEKNSGSELGKIKLIFNEMKSEGVTFSNISFQNIMCYFEFERAIRIISKIIFRKQFNWKEVVFRVVLMKNYIQGLSQKKIFKKFKKQNIEKMKLIIEKIQEKGDKQGIKSLLVIVDDEETLDNIQSSLHKSGCSSSTSLDNENRVDPSPRRQVNLYLKRRSLLKKILNKRSLPSSVNNRELDRYVNYERALLSLFRVVDRALHRLMSSCMQEMHRKVGYRMAKQATLKNLLNQYIHRINQPIQRAFYAWLSHTTRIKKESQKVLKTYRESFDKLKNQQTVKKKQNQSVKQLIKSVEKLFLQQKKQGFQEIYAYFRSQLRVKQIQTSQIAQINLLVDVIKKHLIINKTTAFSKIKTHISNTKKLKYDAIRIINIASLNNIRRKKIEGMAAIALKSQYVLNRNNKVQQLTAVIQKIINLKKYSLKEKSFNLMLNLSKLYKKRADNLAKIAQKIYQKQQMALQMSFNRLIINSEQQKIQQINQELISTNQVFLLSKILNSLLQNQKKTAFTLLKQNYLKSIHKQSQLQNIFQILKQILPTPNQIKQECFQKLKSYDNYIKNAKQIKQAKLSQGLMILQGYLQSKINMSLAYSFNEISIYTYQQIFYRQQKIYKMIQICEKLKYCSIFMAFQKLRFPFENYLSVGQLNKSSSQNSLINEIVKKVNEENKKFYAQEIANQLKQDGDKLNKIEKLQDQMDDLQKKQINHFQKYDQLQAALKDAFVNSSSKYNSPRLTDYNSTQKFYQDNLAPSNNTFFSPSEKKDQEENNNLLQVDDNYPSLVSPEFQENEKSKRTKQPIRDSLIKESENQNDLDNNQKQYIQNPSNDQQQEDDLKHINYDQEDELNKVYRSKNQNGSFEKQQGNDNQESEYENEFLDQKDRNEDFLESKKPELQAENNLFQQNQFKLKQDPNIQKSLNQQEQNKEAPQRLTDQDNYYSNYENPDQAYIDYIKSDSFIPNSDNRLDSQKPQQQHEKVQQINNNIFDQIGKENLIAKSEYFNDCSPISIYQAQNQSDIPKIIVKSEDDVSEVLEYPQKTFQNQNTVQDQTKQPNNFQKTIQPQFGVQNQNEPEINEQQQYYQTDGNNNQLMFKGNKSQDQYNNSINMQNESPNEQTAQNEKQQISKDPSINFNAGSNQRVSQIRVQSQTPVSLIGINDNSQQLIYQNQNSQMQQSREYSPPGKPQMNYLTPSQIKQLMNAQNNPTVANQFYQQQQKPQVEQQQKQSHYRPQPPTPVSLVGNSLLEQSVDLERSLEILNRNQLYPVRQQLPFMTPQQIQQIFAGQNKLQNQSPKSQNLHLIDSDSVTVFEAPQDKSQRDYMLDSSQNEQNADNLRRGNQQDAHFTPSQIKGWLNQSQNQSFSQNTSPTNSQGNQYNYQNKQKEQLNRSQEKPQKDRVNQIRMQPPTPVSLRGQFSQIDKSMFDTTNNNNQNQQQQDDFYKEPIGKPQLTFLTPQQIMQIMRGGNNNMNNDNNSLKVPEVGQQNQQIETIKNRSSSNSPKSSTSLALRIRQQQNVQGYPSTDKIDQDENLPQFSPDNSYDVLSNKLFGDGKIYQQEVLDHLNKNMPIFKFNSSQQMTPNSLSSQVQPQRFNNFRFQELDVSDLSNVLSQQENPLQQNPSNSISQLSILNNLNSQEEKIPSNQDKNNQKQNNRQSSSLSPYTRSIYQQKYNPSIFKSQSTLTPNNQNNKNNMQSASMQNIDRFIQNEGDQQNSNYPSISELQPNENYQDKTEEREKQRQQQQIQGNNQQIYSKQQQNQNNIQNQQNLQSDLNQQNPLLYNDQNKNQYSNQYQSVKNQNYPEVANDKADNLIDQQSQNLLEQQEILQQYQQTLFPNKRSNLENSNKQAQNNNITQNYDKQESSPKNFNQNQITSNKSNTSPYNLNQQDRNRPNSQNQLYLEPNFQQMNPGQYQNQIQNIDKSQPPNSQTYAYYNPQNNQLNDQQNYVKDPNNKQSGQNQNIQNLNQQQNNSQNQLYPQKVDNMQYYINQSNQDHLGKNDNQENMQLRQGIKNQSQLQPQNFNNYEQDQQVDSDILNQVQQMQRQFMQDNNQNNQTIGTSQIQTNQQYNDRDQVKYPNNQQINYQKQLSQQRTPNQLLQKGFDNHNSNQNNYIPQANNFNEGQKIYQNQTQVPQSNIGQPQMYNENRMNYQQQVQDLNVYIPQEYQTQPFQQQKSNENNQNEIQNQNQGKYNQMPQQQQNPENERMIDNFDDNDSDQRKKQKLQGQQEAGPQKQDGIQYGDQQFNIGPIKNNNNQDLNYAIQTNTLDSPQQYGQNKNIQPNNQQYQEIYPNNKNKFQEQENDQKECSYLNQIPLDNSQYQYGDTVFQNQLTPQQKQLNQLSVKQSDPQMLSQIQENSDNLYDQKFNNQDQTRQEKLQTFQASGGSEFQQMSEIIPKNNQNFEQKNHQSQYENQVQAQDKPLTRAEDKFIVQSNQNPNLYYLNNKSIPIKEKLQTFQAQDSDTQYNSQSLPYNIDLQQENSQIYFQNQMNNQQSPLDQSNLSRNQQRSFIDQQYPNSQVEYIPNRNMQDQIDQSNLNRNQQRSLVDWQQPNSQVEYIPNRNMQDQIYQSNLNNQQRSFDDQQQPNQQTLLPNQYMQDQRIDNYQAPLDQSNLNRNQSRSFIERQQQNSQVEYIPNRNMLDQNNLSRNQQGNLSNQQQQNSQLEYLPNKNMQDQIAERDLRGNQQGSFIDQQQPNSKNQYQPSKYLQDQRINNQQVPLDQSNLSRNQQRNFIEQEQPDLQYEQQPNKNAQDQINNSNNIFGQNNQSRVPMQMNQMKNDSLQNNSIQQINQSNNQKNKGNQLQNAMSSDNQLKQGPSQQQYQYQDNSNNGNFNDYNTQQQNQGIPLKNIEEVQSDKNQINLKAPDLQSYLPKIDLSQSPIQNKQNRIQSQKSLIQEVTPKIENNGMISFLPDNQIRPSQALKTEKSINNSFIESPKKQNDTKNLNQPYIVNQVSQNPSNNIMQNQNNSKSQTYDLNPDQLVNSNQNLNSQSQQRQPQIQGLDNTSYNMQQQQVNNPINEVHKYQSQEVIQNDQDLRSNNQDLYDNNPQGYVQQQQQQKQFQNYKSDQNDNYQNQGYQNQVPNSQNIQDKRIIGYEDNADSDSVKRQKQQYQNQKQENDLYQNQSQNFEAYENISNQNPSYDKQNQKLKPSNQIDQNQFNQVKQQQNYPNNSNEIKVVENNQSNNHFQREQSQLNQEDQQVQFYDQGQLAPYKNQQNQNNFKLNQPQSYNQSPHNQIDSQQKDQNIGQEYQQKAYQDQVGEYEQNPKLQPQYVQNAQPQNIQNYYEHQNQPESQQLPLQQQIISRNEKQNSIHHIQQPQFQNNLPSGRAQQNQKNQQYIKQNEQQNYNNDTSEKQTYQIPSALDNQQNFYNQTQEAYQNPQILPLTSQGLQLNNNQIHNQDQNYQQNQSQPINENKMSRNQQQFLNYQSPKPQQNNQFANQNQEQQQQMNQNSLLNEQNSKFNYGENTQNIPQGSNQQIFRNQGSGNQQYSQILPQIMQQNQTLIDDQVQYPNQDMEEDTILQNNNMKSRNEQQQFINQQTGQAESDNYNINMQQNYPESDYDNNQSYVNNRGQQNRDQLEASQMHMQRFKQNENQQDIQNKINLQEIYEKNQNENYPNLNRNIPPNLDLNLSPIYNLQNKIQTQKSTTMEITPNLETNRMPSFLPENQEATQYFYNSQIESPQTQKQSNLRNISQQNVPSQIFYQGQITPGNESNFKQQSDNFRQGQSQELIESKTPQSQINQSQRQNNNRQNSQQQNLQNKGNQFNNQENLNNYQNQDMQKQNQGNENSFEQQRVQENQLQHKIQERQNDQYVQPNQRNSFQDPIQQNSQNFRQLNQNDEDDQELVKKQKQQIDNKEDLKSNQYQNDQKPLYKEQSHDNKINENNQKNYFNQNEQKQGQLMSANQKQQNQQYFNQPNQRNSFQDPIQQNSQNFRQLNQNDEDDQELVKKQKQQIDNQQLQESQNSQQYLQENQYPNREDIKSNQYYNDQKPLYKEQSPDNQINDKSQKGYFNQSEQQQGQLTSGQNDIQTDSFYNKTQEPQQNQFNQQREALNFRQITPDQQQQIQNNTNNQSLPQLQNQFNQNPFNDKAVQQNLQNKGYEENQNILQDQSIENQQNSRYQPENIQGLLQQKIQNQDGQFSNFNQQQNQNQRPMNYLIDPQNQQKAQRNSSNQILQQIPMQVDNIYQNDQNTNLNPRSLMNQSQVQNQDKIKQNEVNEEYIQPQGVHFNQNVSNVQTQNLPLEQNPQNKDILDYQQKVIPLNNQDQQFQQNQNPFQQSNSSSAQANNQFSNTTPNVRNQKSQNNFENKNPSQNTKQSQSNQLPGTQYQNLQNQFQQQGNNQQQLNLKGKNLKQDIFIPNEANLQHDQTNSHQSMIQQQQPIIQKTYSFEQNQKPINYRDTNNFGQTTQQDEQAKQNQLYQNKQANQIPYQDQIVNLSAQEQQDQNDNENKFLNQDQIQYEKVGNQPNLIAKRVIQNNQQPDNLQLNQRTNNNLKNQLYDQYAASDKNSYDQNLQNEIPAPIDLNRQNRSIQQNQMANLQKDPINQQYMKILNQGPINQSQANLVHNQNNESIEQSPYQNQNTEQKLKPSNDSVARHQSYSLQDEQKTNKPIQNMINFNNRNLIGQKQDEQPQVNQQIGNQQQQNIQNRPQQQVYNPIEDRSINKQIISQTNPQEKNKSIGKQQPLTQQQQMQNLNQQNKNFNDIEQQQIPQEKTEENLKQSQKNRQIRQSDIQPQISQQDKYSYDKNEIPNYNSEQQQNQQIIKLPQQNDRDSYSDNSLQQKNPSQLLDDYYYEGNNLLSSYPQKFQNEMNQLSQNGQRYNIQDQNQKRETPNNQNSNRQNQQQIKANQYGLQQQPFIQQAQIKQQNDQPLDFEGVDFGQYPKQVRKAEQNPYIQNQNQIQQGQFKQSNQDTSSFKNQNIQNQDQNDQQNFQNKNFKYQTPTHLQTENLNNHNKFNKHIAQPQQYIQQQNIEQFQGQPRIYEDGDVDKDNFEYYKDDLDSLDPKKAQIEQKVRQNQNQKNNLPYQNAKQMQQHFTDPQNQIYDHNNYLNRRNNNNFNQEKQQQPIEEQNYPVQKNRNNNLNEGNLNFNKQIPQFSEQEYIYPQQNQLNQQYKQLNLNRIPSKQNEARQPNSNSAKQNLTQQGGDIPEYEANQYQQFPRQHKNINNQLPQNAVQRNKIQDLESINQDQDQQKLSYNEQVIKQMNQQPNLQQKQQFKQQTQNTDINDQPQNEFQTKGSFENSRIQQQPRRYQGDNDNQKPKLYNQQQEMSKQQQAQVMPQQKLNMQGQFGSQDQNPNLNQIKQSDFNDNSYNNQFKNSNTFQKQNSSQNISQVNQQQNEKGQLGRNQQKTNTDNYINMNQNTQKGFSGDNLHYPQTTADNIHNSSKQSIPRASLPQREKLDPQTLEDLSDIQQFLESRRRDRPKPKSILNVQILEDDPFSQ
ncbi:hypothetical protein ABPG73_014223 [Tetrahymena malaccensis]